MFISKDVDISGVTLEPSPNFFSYGLVAALANIQSNFNCSSLWDYENLFETGVVRANEGLLQSQLWRDNRHTFSIVFNMKVYCVFSLESPQPGDSNEYTQYTIFSI